MGDPLLAFISALGTPAGMILIWWHLNSGIKAVKDDLKELKADVKKENEKLDKRHEDCSAKIHDRITDISVRTAHLEGN